MSIPTPHTTTGHKPLWVTVIILLAVRILFIMLMPQVYSRDLYAWLDVTDVLRAGGNPYEVTGVLNWPPFWMQIIFFAGRLSDVLHIPTTLIIQSILIAGEVTALTLCYAILTRFFRKHRITSLLITALAINPVSVFLSCQHCNFDILVSCWILLFLYTLMEYVTKKREEYWLAACFFLGMGILAKTIPIILCPLLILGIRERAKTITLTGTLMVLTPVCIGMSIIYTLAPVGVSAHVLSYRSMSGWYGFTGILHVLHAETWVDAWSAASPFLLSTVMLTAAWRLLRRTTLTAHQIVAAALSLLVFLPTFGPGYSPPYILWFLPLVVMWYTTVSCRVQWMLVTGYALAALTYITEYAFFESHGAFMKTLVPGDSMATLCHDLSRSSVQPLIRLPLFIWYLVLYTHLLLDRNNPLTHN